MPNIKLNLECDCRHSESCGWNVNAKNRISDSDLPVGKYHGFKQLYWMSILIGTLIALMIGSVGWIMIHIQETGQSALMSASMAIVVAAIAIIVTAIFGYVFHVMQSKQNAVHHKEQMDAIKRLEDDLKKNQGGQE